MHRGTFGGSAIGVSQYALKYRISHREILGCSAAASRRINTLMVGVAESQLQIYVGTENLPRLLGWYRVVCGTLECRVDYTDSNLGPSTARGRAMPDGGVMKEPKPRLCFWDDQNAHETDQPRGAVWHSLLPCWP